MNIKRYLLITLSILLFFKVFAQSNERVYVHTDKVYYQPGETIWFQTYLKSENTTNISRFFELALIDPSGNKYQSLRLVNKNHKAAGQFDLSANAAGGVYQLIAQSERQLKYNEKGFEQELTIQNNKLPSLLFEVEFSEDQYGLGAAFSAEVKVTNKMGNPLSGAKVKAFMRDSGQKVDSSSIFLDEQGKGVVKYQLPAQLKSPYLLLTVDYKGKVRSYRKPIPVIQDYTVEVFPEGGYLAAHSKGRIAYRITPAPKEGMVLKIFGDKEDALIEVPVRNSKGLLDIETSSSVVSAALFEGENLMAAGEEIQSLPKGVNLIVQPSEDSEKLAFQLNTSKRQKVFVRLKMEEGKQQMQAITLEKGVNNLKLSTAGLPMGLAYLQCFDKKNRPIIERLVWVNNHKQLQINIKPEKEVFDVGEEIEIEVEVKDDQGNPIQSVFSMAVTDERVWNLGNVGQKGIYSSLLLPKDLIAEIGDEVKWFDKVNSHEEVDLLLLTTGWRAFEWQKEVPEIRETEPLVRGKVIGGLKGNIYSGEKFSKKAIVSIKNPITQTWVDYETNEEGDFSITHFPFDFEEGQVFDIKTTGSLSKKTTYFADATFHIGDSLVLEIEHNETREMYLPKQLNQLWMEYDVYFNEQKQQAYKVPKWITVLVPSEFTLMGIDQPLVKVKYQDALQWLSQQEKGQWVDYSNALKRMRYDQALEKGLYQAELGWFINPVSNEYMDRSFWIDGWDYFDNFKVSNDEVCDIEFTLEDYLAIYEMAEDTYQKDSIWVEKLYGLFPSVKNIKEVLPVFYTYSDKGSNRNFSQLLDQRDQSVLSVSYTLHLDFCANSAYLSTDNTSLPFLLLNGIFKGNLQPYNMKGGKMELTDLEDALCLVEEETYWDGSEDDYGYADDGFDDGWGDEGGDFGIESPFKQSVSIFSKKNNQPSFMEVLPVVIEDNPIDKVNITRVEKNDYYYKKVFPKKVIDQHNKGIRTDFNTTVYWNGAVETNQEGKASIRFLGSDAISSFRVQAMSSGNKGLLGSGMSGFKQQLPVTLEVQLPKYTLVGDTLILPIELMNLSSEDKVVNVNMILPKEVVLLEEDVLQAVKVISGNSKIIYPKIYMKRKLEMGIVDVALVDFNTNQLIDKVQLPIKVLPVGFPVSIHKTGMLNENNPADVFKIPVGTIIPNTFEVGIEAFPNKTNMFMTAVEGLLREPYGCFEQVSATTYPNMLVLDFMKSNHKADKALQEKAHGMIERGYNKLIKYETAEGGFEWFGSAPGNLALTAYGLLEFTEMQKFYDQVDKAMLTRTRDWLLEKRDGEGGFKLRDAGYGHIGATDKDVTNAYVVYAMVKSGVAPKLLSDEYKAAMKTGLGQKDVYQLALLACVAKQYQESDYSTLMNALLNLKDSDGWFKGRKHSITYSKGESFKIETSALVLMAMLKDKKKYEVEINDLYQKLLMENAAIHYGNSQAIVMALSAMNAYNKQDKNRWLTNTENYDFSIKTGEKKVFNQSFNPSSLKPVIGENFEIKPLSKVLSLKVESNYTKDLLYDFYANWRVSLPYNHEHTTLEMEMVYPESTSTTYGGLLPLNITLKNKSTENLGMTVVMVGLPAGTVPFVEELEVLKEKGIMDYYEILGEYLVLYYRGFAANTSKEITIELDNIFPGSMQAPTSCVYEYYNEENKFWTSAESVQINLPAHD